jgi:hypothetical protein
MADEQWNPRYVLYARAHGRTPEEMLAHDDEAFPGGIMAGFIIWINQQWNAFVEFKKCSRHWVRWYDREFDPWLTARAEGLTSSE